MDCDADEIEPLIGQSVGFNLSVDMKVSCRLLALKRLSLIVIITAVSYTHLDVYKRQDFRSRIQLKTQLNKVGLLAGYSIGLTNFQTQDNPKAYSSFLRLGVSYQLK